MNPASSRAAISLRAGLILLLAMAAVPPASRAVETNAPAARADRYLFILDISSGMKKRAANTETTIAQLIASGMNGQMKRGDTLGFWLFNDRPYAGMIPLQTWSQERRLQMAQSVVTVLHDAPYGKKAQFTNVLGQLQRLVRDSERLTILLVSEGTPIGGTPFDGDINSYFKNNFDVQRDARMPFVTVLRTKAGEYLGQIVTAAPWPVEFPEFPPEPVVEMPKPKTEDAPKPAAKPTVAPLIVIGTKRETNLPPAMMLPQPQVIPPMPEPKPRPRTANEILAAQMLAEAQMQDPAAKPANVSPPESQPVTPAPQVTEPTKMVSPAPQNLPAKVPLPAAPPTPAPAAKPASAAAPPVKEATPVPETKPAASANPAVQTLAAGDSTAGQMAVAAPDSGRPLRVWFLAAGAALLGLAGGIIFMLLRRPRPASQESYITRALDRDQK